LALAYSPLGDRAKLEQMLVYATLQVSIQELPKNSAEFQQLLTETKKQFLANGQQTLSDLTEIFTQWQQIRRDLLVLDQSIFGRSVDDIEDQLDLMSLANFVYSRPAEIWQEYPRYLKALLLRLDRLPNNLQRDLAAIDDVDPWMDKVFKFKNDPKIKELYLMLEEFRISLFSQPMKTKLPISPTRLQKLWDRLAIG